MGEDVSNGLRMGLASLAVLAALSGGLAVGMGAGSHARGEASWFSSIGVGGDGEWAAVRPVKSGPVARAKARAGLAELPIVPRVGEDVSSLALRLVDKDTFLALALSVENAPKRAYVDAAGANAGAGYCVDARRRAHGDEEVKSDLERAGFDAIEVAHLMSRDSARVESVAVDFKQTLRLLSITKPHYEGLARAAIGEEEFAKLPAHRRDVLSYISYNTGGPDKFVNLLRAVKSGDDVSALSEMAPKFRWGGSAAKPKFKMNHRLRAWAQAAWMGPAALRDALASPVAFERSYAGSLGQDKFIRNHMAFFSSVTPSQFRRLSAPTRDAARPQAKASKPARAGKERKPRPKG